METKEGDRTLEPNLGINVIHKELFATVLQGNSHQGATCESSHSSSCEKF